MGPDDRPTRTAVNFLAKSYWRISDVPALRHLTPKERRAILRKYWSRGARWPWAYVWITINALGSVAILNLVFTITKFRGDTIPILYFIPILIWAAPVAVAMDQHWKRWLNRTVLNENLHLCQTGGYDLRASPDRCPECGAARVEAESRDSR